VEHPVAVCANWSKVFDRIDEVFFPSVGDLLEVMDFDESLPG
jgi:hypothetical protein